MEMPQALDHVGSRRTMGDVGNTERGVNQYFLIFFYSSDCQSIYRYVYVYTEHRNQQLE